MADCTRVEFLAQAFGQIVENNGGVVAAPVFIGDKNETVIQEMQSKLKGAIVLSQPIQTVFERADRPQPTLSDAPVAIGQPRRTGPSPSTTRRRWRT